VQVVDENGNVVKTTTDTNQLLKVPNNQEVPVIKLKTSTLFITLFSLLGVAILVALVWIIAKRRRKEETEEERKRKARKKLIEKLDIAKNHLEQGDISKFYHETLIGLSHYVNQKLSIETSQMTKESIRSTLFNKGVSEDSIQSFIEVLQECEMAKYASLSNQNNWAIYERSLEVIEELESQLK